MIPSNQQNCPRCGGPFPAALSVGSTALCAYCGNSYQVVSPAQPAAAAATSGVAVGAGGGSAPREAPLASRGTDPLASLVIKGIWRSIQTGHELVYFDRDWLLDWQPASGQFSVWHYDRTVSSGDPLPSAIVQGTWGSIRAGHELIWLGGDHLLDWEPASGAFRVWWVDRDARASADMLPSVVTKGTWASIQASKRLVYLGHDALLDWEPASGRFRIWRYDRNGGGADPLPGQPLCEGVWQSVRTGHELVPCGEDAVLDWVPDAGNFRFWRLDHSARGQGDPLPTELASGNWESIRSGHRLVYLGGDRVLDWEPASGAYRIWTLARR
jgi:hypothetical protein